MTKLKHILFSIMLIAPVSYSADNPKADGAPKAEDKTPAAVFMSAQWATQACAAWNADEDLTTKLFKSGWVKNAGKRGYKIMQIYRKDCDKSPRVEMHIAVRDDKAMCVYGGTSKTPEDQLDGGVDYKMWALDKHWERMGNGKDGPMKAMMFSRLKFKGPKMEAMRNMGPFAGFLLLTGKVPSDRSSCPK